MSSRVFALCLWVSLVCSWPASADIAGQHWFPLGPAPIENFFGGGAVGRASAIAVNPANIDELWIGTAAGGVWHSVNGGRNWRPISDKQSALAIGALAVTQCTTAGCNKIYAGTGENAIRRDTYYGRGLLVFDGGAKSPGWSRRSGVPFDFDYGSINSVVLDPSTSGASQRVFVTLSSGNTSSASQATVTAPVPGAEFGVYRSDNDGQTWQRLVVPGADGAKPTMLKMHPSDTSRLIVGFAGVGAFQTTDGGDTWCPLNEGVAVPSGCPTVTGLAPSVTGGFDHVDIAWHEAGPQTLYVSFGHCADQLLQSCQPSIFRSTDGAQTFALRRQGSVSGNGIGCGSVYSRYTHVLTVDPDVPDVLFLGGVRLCRSSNGGTSFVESDNNLAPGGSPWGPITHLDHRELVFHPLDSDRVYSTNDGGFAFSLDGGLNWEPGNDDLQITGFYSLTAASNTPRVIGGSQDNSGQLWLGFRGWEHTGFGDGAYAVIDQTNPLLFFLGGNRGAMYRSFDGGVTFTASIRPPGTTSSNTAFNAPLVQDALPPHTLYYGSNRLHASTSAGDTWTVASPVLAGGSAPEISPGINVVTAIGARGSRVFVGYYSGDVFTSTAPCDNASCWTNVGGDLPDAPITDIVIDPEDAATAYLALSGFHQTPHVVRTQNGGKTWTGASDGLPDGVPANALAIELDGTLWVGLDSGPDPDRANVYKSTDGGATWLPRADSLPNGPVHDLAIDDMRGRLYVGLHGRGAYVLGPATLGIYEGRVDGQLQDLPVYGDSFTPNQNCVMRLLQQNGDVCATSSTDALGATIRTDARGRLVSRGGVAFQDKAAVWACFAGRCIDNTPIAQCEDDANGDGQADPLTTVTVNCDGTPAVATVTDGPALTNPPGSLIDIGFFEVNKRSGTVHRSAPLSRSDKRLSLNVTAALITDGAVRTGCRTPLQLRAGQTTDSLIADAARAIASSDDCQQRGITARTVTLPKTKGEDLLPRSPSLTVSAKEQVGEQVVAGIDIAAGDAPPGTCVSLRGLGVPIYSQLRAMKATFSTPRGGAQGGYVTYIEKTGQGTCAVTVATSQGDAAASIAGAIEAVMMGQSAGPHCEAAQNARTTRQAGDALVTRFASDITVCLQDEGVGLSVAPL